MRKKGISESLEKTLRPMGGDYFESQRRAKGMYRHTYKYQFSQLQINLLSIYLCSLNVIPIEIISQIEGLQCWRNVNFGMN